MENCSFSKQSSSQIKAKNFARGVFHKQSFEIRRKNKSHFFYPTTTLKHKACGVVLQHAHITCK